MWFARNSLLLRNRISSLRYMSAQRTWEEVRFPLYPFAGEVAGKWWGPKDRKPILALHGWQDNCGTFDRLIPLLPPDVSVLAVDLPGHGLSGQLPPGIFYHGIDLIAFIRRIMEHFNWSKVSLLGHSLGAMHSFAYSMLYPETVEFVVCLEGLVPLLDPKNRTPQAMARTVDSFLKYDAINSSNKTPPDYSFSDMELLWHKGSKQSIDLKYCKYILNRNIAPVPNKPDRFYFTRDLRLKVAALLHWNNDTIMEGSARVTCPLYFVMGKSSPFALLEQIFEVVLDAVKENNKNVEFHKMEGTHHLHLNNPEIISGSLSDFIEKHYTPEQYDDIENKITVVQ